MIFEIRTGHKCQHTKLSQVKQLRQLSQRLRKKINRPNAGLLPDFNNFGRYNRYEGVTKSLPFAPAVCAKALKFDAKGNETNTDYYRMLKIIYESDFSGVISIEFEGGGIDPIEGSLKTKALIQKAIKAAMA